MAYIVIKGDELYHHGVKGMHWGVRRYQNKDGSLTSAGRKRYTDYKPAIKEYRDSYDKASSMNDAADAKWRDVQAARKELGRTAIGRTIASARNKTEAAKKYNRMYDEWSKMQDDADEQWRDADEKYKHTGGNRLTRIANNIRYDTKLGSAKSGEKKQLTDEEKAARNAKIKSTAKKVAIGVGVAALAAAGTYAAVKYGNKTMTEAKQMMSSSRKAKLDRYVDELTAIDDQEVFTRKMFNRSTTADQMTQWNFANQEAKGRLADKLTEREAYKRASERHMADKSVQRKAQREVIKRDIRNALDRSKSHADTNTKRARTNISNLLEETEYERRLREMADEQARKIKNRR